MRVLPHHIPLPSTVFLGFTRHSTNIHWVDGSTASVCVNLPGRGCWPLSTQSDLISSVFCWGNCRMESLWLSTVFLTLLSGTWFRLELPGVGQLLQPEPQPVGSGCTGLSRVGH